MLASARLPLGAPGLYPLPDAVTTQLNPQRMDVCAFVGVAPRGPAHQPVVDPQWPAGWRMMADAARPRRRSVAVPVNSFDEYRALFGAFEGPGLLPYAVASFFEQGGRRAWIVRIVPRQDPPPLSDPPAPFGLAGMAQGQLAGVCTSDLIFLARNEGSWGNALHVEFGFSARPLAVSAGPANTLLLPLAQRLSAGTLLRLTDALGAQMLVYCRGSVQRNSATGPDSWWELQFDAPLPLLPLRADIVEAWIDIRDNGGRTERFTGLALHPEHASSLHTVLCNESQLVWPHYSWAGSELLPAHTAVELLRARSAPFAGGSDSYGDLVAEDFFDMGWSAAEEQAGEGISAIAGSREVTHLLVPDLYVPGNWAGPDIAEETRIDEAGPEFARCVRSRQQQTASSVSPSLLEGLLLDPRRAADLQQIIALQQRLIDFCEATQDCIALLDVPPGLSLQQAECWRNGFDSSWTAAYHPWLIASRRAPGLEPDRRDTLRPLPPSAVAAGLIARKERQYGVQYGPANEVANGIVNLAEALPEGRVDRFHPLGLNCFTRDCQGICLQSARTLSRDQQWRQLSVRRLLLMLRRTLLRETQWAVFEPNGPRLWSDLRHAIENLLRRLYRRGAFAGASERESFFVRLQTDSSTRDRGQLIIDIGVAPAEPIEYILLQLRRDGDGTLTLEEQEG